MKRIFLTLISLLSVCIGLMAADKPQFPGGQPALDKYISQNLKYPATAKENGVEGIVGVQFIVGTDGSISSVKIVRMVDPDLEEEAVRLVKNMPAWEPAEKNGSPVEAPAQVSIPFEIE